MPRAGGVHNQISKAVLRTLATPFESSGTSGGFFRCSETSVCDRRVWYARQGEKPTNPFSAVTRLKMNRGDVLHDYIRGKLIPKLTPYQVSYWNPELQLASEYKSGRSKIFLRGHCDGLLIQRGSGRPLAVLEIKTQGIWPFKKCVKIYDKIIRKEPLLPEEASHYSQGFLLQGNRYVRLWNDAYPKLKVDRLCLLLFNVNGDPDETTGLPMRDYWFKYDDKLFKKDIERLARVERSIGREEAPEKFYEKIGWQCEGCQWFNICWSSSERKSGASRSSKKPKSVSSTRAKANKRTVSRRSSSSKRGTDPVLGDSQARRQSPRRLKADAKDAKPKARRKKVGNHKAAS